MSLQIPDPTVILVQPNDEQLLHTYTTKQLLKLRRTLNKDNYKMHKAISANKNKITKLDSQLWLTCEHKWIYDEWASFDDRVKHICKICKCYRDPRLYI